MLLNASVTFLTAVTQKTDRGSPREEGFSLVHNPRIQFIIVEQERELKDGAVDHIAATVRRWGEVNVSAHFLVWL